MPSLQGHTPPSFAYSPSYNPFLSVSDDYYAPHDDISAFDSVYDSICSPPESSHASTGIDPPYTSSSVTSSSAVDYLSSDFYGPDDSLTCTASETPRGLSFSSTPSSQPIAIPQDARASFLTDLLDVSLSVTAPQPSVLQGSWPNPAPISTSLPSAHLMPHKAPSPPLSSQSSISSPTTHNTSLSESESIHKASSDNGHLRSADLAHGIDARAHLASSAQHESMISGELIHDADLAVSRQSSAVSHESFGDSHSLAHLHSPGDAQSISDPHLDTYHGDDSQDESNDETLFPEDTLESPELTSAPPPPLEPADAPPSSAPPDYMSLPLMFDSVVANKAPVPAPRVEEGHEALPPYSCTVHLEGYFPRKQEFVGKIVSSDRSWRSKYILIVGTVMKIYKHDLASHPIADHHDWSADKATDLSGSDPSSLSRFFIEGQVANPESPYSPLSSTSSNNYPPRISARLHQLKDNVRAKTHLPPSNQLVSELSLQHAECGLATDYLKHPFVVRVRTPKEQFLVQCADAHGAVTFIETVQAASNISLDLDERPMPKAASSRRRRRRRNRRVAVNASRGSASHGGFPRESSQSRSLAHEEARRNRDILRDVAALRLAI